MHSYENNDMGAVFAQTVNMDFVQEGLRFIKQDEEKFIDELIEITKIEAPTFYEQNRAKYMVEHFEKLGLEDVHIDQFGNAIGVLKGTNPSFSVVLDAHMDTVFPFGSVKEVIRDGDYLKAPGVSDDNRGLATLLSLIRAFNTCGAKPTNDIIFLGSTREEGLGMLGGMRDFMSENGDSVGAIIAIDGEKVPDVVYRATGMITAEAVFTGVSGHAGMNGLNALHACVKAAARVADFQTSLDDDLTTLNVTVFHAGSDTEVHVRPEKASFKYNIRSNSPTALSELNAKIMDACENAVAEENAQWKTEALSFNRIILAQAPANCSQKEDSPLLQMVSQAISWLGYKPNFSSRGCTNASWGVEYGKPSVCVGMNMVDEDMNFTAFLHNLNEQTYLKNAYKSVQYPWILALLCAGVDDKIESIL